MKLTLQERKTFGDLTKKYLQDERVRSMNHYIQHGSITTLQHCIMVAETGFLLNRRLHLGANEESLVRAALLHDFYLYDWHEKSDDHKLHGFTHARKAAENARRFFAINQQEYRAINSHMWPLTLTKLPVSRIGWILCVADKYCAMKETIFHRR